MASTRCCCRIASRSTKPRFRKDENCCSNCLCCADRIADSAPKSTTPRTSRVKMTTTLNNLLRRFKRLKLRCFLDLFDFTQYRPYIRFSITHLLLWAALDNLLHGPLVSLCVCVHACPNGYTNFLRQACLDVVCVVAWMADGQSARRQGKWKRRSGQARGKGAVQGRAKVPSAE